MTQDDKMNALAEIFDVDVKDLKPETDLTSLTWDSMTKIALIALAREACGVRITGDMLKAYRTIQDILNTLT